ncbi:surface lipoprotein assembly modifier [Gallibacterium salpingitidis]|uniref:surface lipoprotein assembly modifier n=1 Tax=Gallibacterium salpingitidis TaxID=505341 RepID=UPI00266F82FA|nr:surface lipoprotein assembly modifier [Gallibacterium salpingitidis]WKT00895.1 surface lipoprotein assembly modifier [Gallibacterium salpingitidis]
MKKRLLTTLLPFTLIPIDTLAQTEVLHTPPEIEDVTVVAKPEALTQSPVIEHSTEKTIKIAITDLQHNPQLAEKILNQAILQRNYAVIAKVLPIYQAFSDKDEILVLFAEGTLADAQQQYAEAINKFRQILAINPQLNPVRIALAITLFKDQQNSAAEDQFNKAKTAENIPAPIKALIDRYLTALEQRSGWKTSFSVNYLQDHNVNNTSSTREIENTGFIKADQMLPQSAHGVAYSFNLSKDINLFGAHYLSLENNLFGKFYWDNRDYNDVLNRTYVGYTHKSAEQTWRLLPFYERRWIGDKRYQWSNGVRGEWNRWLSTNWQLSTALEYAKQHYFTSEALNGHNQLASMTVLWLRTPQQYFYFGSDFYREKTAVKQYSHDAKTLRLGWGQEWYQGISSRLSVAFTKRDYKDQAVLANILPLGKVRADKIYQANLMLWKRDWYFWGITPKVRFSWKKQDSNIPSMYAYTDKNVNLVFEKTF